MKTIVYIILLFSFTTQDNLEPIENSTDKTEIRYYSEFDNGGENISIDIGINYCRAILFYDSISTFNYIKKLNEKKINYFLIDRRNNPILVDGKNLKFNNDFSKISVLKK